MIFSDRSPKTIELRKTKPKLPLPYLAYIYETKSGGGSGMVVGRFACYRIDTIEPTGNPELPLVIRNSDGSVSQVVQEYINKTGLTVQEILEYANGKPIYAIQILF